MKRYREDKSPDEADTIDAPRALLPDRMASEAGTNPNWTVSRA